MFEPIVALGRYIPTKQQLYWRNWHRPHLNFITVHYLYMIGWAIIGSIMLWPAGIMDYVDALFFAAGAATQSGLNTIDINALHTYQQVVFLFIACVANPIFINTVVVFVRLYWFEKKFQHMVKASNEARRTKTRSFSRTFTKTGSMAQQHPGQDDPDRLERGVGAGGLFGNVPLRGRPITVLHDTTKPNGMSGPTAKSRAAEEEFAEKHGLGEPRSISVSPTPPEGSNSSSRSDDVAPDEKSPEDHDFAPERQPQMTESEPNTPVANYLGLPARLSREITFQDETPNGQPLPTPGSRHAQQSPNLSTLEEGAPTDTHIKFVEQQQQNARRGTGTLRIPGPRDFDRGELPQELDDSDDDGLRRPQTRNTMDAISEPDRDRRASTMGHDGRLDTEGTFPRRAITINVPDHPGHRARHDSDTEEVPYSGGGIMTKIRSGLGHRRGPSHNNNLPSATTKRSGTFSSLMTSRTREADPTYDPMPYLSWQATTARNSQFVGLTAEQREELGGIEYRSLKTLAKILVFYYVGFHIMAMICFLPWILHTTTYRDKVVKFGVDPGWWGVFTAQSMFNDLGFTLTPDSMNSFNNAIWPLLIGSFFIIIGNTGFPCMLRFVIWVYSLFSVRGTGLWEELRFLLDHPRRCFTLLFPSKATWWLFWVLVILNAVDLIFFIILDLNDETVQSLAPGIRVLDGWFQATSTRTAGFSCVNLANLHPAIQVSYLIMMYISVFPIAISVRRTNVYEEKSLGIWGAEDEAAGGDSEQSYVGQHLRRQLSFDLWYVFLGFFIICIVEGGKLEATNLKNENYAFTMFAVLFEIVSAYGTVGLSLGWPTANTSFSAQFHVISKLVIIAMMIRGRHRGLPYALDRAIMLPSEKMHKKDDEAMSLSHRRNSQLETGELDEAFHDGHEEADAAMTAGAGGDRSPERLRHLRRRGSELTTASRQSTGREGGVGQAMRRHQRSRSIGQVIISGLNPAPTSSKWD